MADTPRILCNTGNVEWYTPPKIINAVREVLGEIDLDPASCESANTIVRAKKFYTAADNGLVQNWYGRIYLNPPFTRGVIDKFVDKLLSSNFDTAITLSNAATDSRWFRKLATAADVLVFSAGRIRFANSKGIPRGSPTCGQAFCYFGGEPQKFIEVFSRFGWAVTAKG